MCALELGCRLRCRMPLPDAPCTLEPLGVAAMSKARAVETCVLVRCKVLAGCKICALYAVKLSACSAGMSSLPFRACMLVSLRPLQGALARCLWQCAIWLVKAFGGGRHF
ncbi:unnamed protein product [Durusdinium trenchii]|uniref:Uncharacterized protein n=1 Tax=Durusdinium trenchii TaxID=1381693 RepID=A0ABP0HIF0_9DINO